MSRRTIYWICQISGWSTYSLTDLGLYSLKYDYSDTLVINALVTIFMGITITHLYRLLIRRSSWLDLSLYQLIPRIIISVTLMAVVMVMISFPLDYYTVPGMKKYLMTEIPSPIIFYWIVNWGKHLLLWSLIYHMFQYFERSKNNEIDKVRLATSVKEFEAKILRSQLNPHFVFNALNSIRALVLENPEKAQVSVTRLSNILRNSLLADRQRTVTLNEELKTVQDYLSLEKIRYEDRLNVRTNISPDTLNIQVPPMMVQTLVENAVKHGISKPIQGGFISIDAQLAPGRDFLSLQIRNTGVLQKINSDGFGLLNTSQRLGLIYGSAASFDIHQESEEVVCAQVKLPVH